MPTNKKAVVILGAGASAPFGVPTLANVFKDQHARRHLNADAFLKEKLEQIFWCPRGHNLETSNLTINVEEILTLANDSEADLYDVDIPSLLGEDIDQFRRSLYVLIKKAVFDGKNSRAEHLNSLIDFTTERYDEVLWASFNWDCIFESSFYYNSGSPHNYTRHNPKIVLQNLLGWRHSASMHTFVKLHGGINWWFEDGNIHYLSFGGGEELNDKWQRYENNETAGSPVILEPSFYKYEDPLLGILKPQWKKFVEELIDADEIIIIGYSLPASDPESRKALTISLQANINAKICVIDRSDSVCERYERQFGSNRTRCVSRDLADVSSEIANLLEENFNY